MNNLTHEIRIIKDIKKIIYQARTRTVHALNYEMLKAYYTIGKRIVEEEQKGEKRASYGKKLIERISEQLSIELGKGFSTTALKNMRLFYNIYKNKISQSVTDEFYKLSWTHYCELIKVSNESKRKYFERYAINENLSVRDLKRQIYSLHYERLELSRNKKALIAYEKKGNIPTKAEEIIKDPYILEFLNLKEEHTYTERDLETKILDNLQKFIMELGQGFSFVARQKRFNIDNDNFYIDMLFYHIYLKCYIIIELKTSKFKHEDVGQINFYLNYVKNELNTPDDNEPIGIILCTEKDTIQVKYATEGMSNKMFISKYQAYLPTKTQLKKCFEEII